MSREVIGARPRCFGGPVSRGLATLVALAVGGLAVGERLAEPFGPLASGWRVLLAEQALLWTLAAGALWAPRSAVVALDEAFAELAQRRPLLVAAVGVGLPLVWVLLTTPQITYGAGPAGVGYGHDGRFYGAMAERLGDPALRIDPPFHQRPLAPALVWASGLPTFVGFRALAMLGAVGTAWGTFRIARALDAERPVALILMLLVMGAEQGVKSWWHAPVSADPLGTALGLAAVDAVLRGRPGVFAVALGAGLLCRENLVLLVPFQLVLLIRRRRALRPHTVPVHLLATAVALAPAVALRLAPPLVPPSRPADLWFTLRVWSERILFVPGRQQMLVYAYGNALGVLVLGVAGRLREAIGFLGHRAPEWGLLLVGLGLAGPLFGADYDRFAFWTLPVWVAVWAGTGLGRGRLGRGALVLVGLQLAAGELPIPWATDEIFSLGRNAAHPVAGSFAPLTLSVWGYALAVAAVWRGGDPEAAGPPGDDPTTDSRHRMAVADRSADG